MAPVTLVGLPPGLTTSSVYDPGTGLTFEPGVTVDVDDPTVEERFKSLEQMGYTFLFGDPSPLDTVVAPPDPTLAVDSAAPIGG